MNAKIILPLLTILAFSGSAAATLPAMPQYHQRVLSNGLTVLISEEHTLPMISVYLLQDAGSWRDPKGREGLANLTVEAVRLGTVSHTASEISEILDFRGASLESFCGRDFVLFGFHTLKRNFEKVFDLFQEMLCHPTFPEKEILHKVAETRAGIRSSHDKPGVVAMKAFRSTLFKEGSYGHPVKGTENSLDKISRDDVAAFHRKFYRPNLGILAVVGNIEPKEISTAVEAPLEAWERSDAPASSFKSEFTLGPKVVETDRPIDQAHIVLGHQGIDRSNPDYYALVVMNHILGAGGFGSRLMQKIRVERGLVYSVDSEFNALKHRGCFQITLQTKNETAAEAVRIALDEMKKIQENGVTEAELSTAKKYLTGNFPLQMITRDRFARFIVQVEYHGLGKDYYDKYPFYINAVSREDVLRAARSHLHPEQYVLSIVADLDKVDLAWLKPKSQ